MKAGRSTTGSTAFSYLLPLLTTLLVVILGSIRQLSSMEIIKSGILSLTLTSATVFYVRLRKDDILSLRYAKIIISFSYIISILLIFLPLKQEIDSFWMIGSFAVAFMLDNILGLLLHFNLTFLAGIALSLRPEILLYLMIMGVMMSVLSAYLKNKSTVIFASIILLSSNVTLTFLVNSFIYETGIDYNYLTSLFSILVVIVVAFYLSRFYELAIHRAQNIDSGNETDELKQKLSKPGLPDSLASEQAAGLQELQDRKEAQDGIEIPCVQKDLLTDPENSEAIAKYQDDVRTSLELLNETGNGLLQRMKDFSEGIYEHALKIGDVASRAAKTIGADEKLARAGGLYHDIGKIKGSNYIEEGLSIADEYGFPKELKNIIRQHNFKYEKPTSVEATIVLLSDSIMSTLEYIEKNEEHRFTPGKIIDYIFQTRMEKGTFDSSGLSVKDFKALKDFFQQEFNGKEAASSDYTD